MNPNYEYLRASGTKDYYNAQQMSYKPAGKVVLVPPDVSTLVNFVSADQAFTLLLINDTDNLYNRYVGMYIDQMKGKVDLEKSLELDLDVQCYDMLTTNAPGTPVLPSASTSSLTFKDVTLSKDASTISDWTKLEFDLNKNLIRLLKPSDGTTRALYSIIRDNSVTFTRTMATDNGPFDEVGDIRADTARTIKVLVTNRGGGSKWSYNLAGAKTDDDDYDLMKPADMVGKEIKYVGKDVTFGTS
jgi:hypothetical protein